MTTLGRHTGVVRDDLSFIEDSWRQQMAGLAPNVTTPTLRRDNMPRLLANADTASLSDGVMTSVALFLREGDIVTNLTFKSGATAAVNPAHWWFALYDPDLALMAQTADQAAGAWAANTVKTIALATAQTITETGIYYASIMVDVGGGGAVPTLVGRSVALAGASAAWLTGESILAQTSGAALTTTAPATIAAATTVELIPRVIAT